MSEKRYDVVFRGDIELGFKLPQVKTNLQHRLKLDDHRLTSLFSGKPVAIKRDVSLEEAQKYQRVLKAAGAIITLELNESQNEQSDDELTHLNNEPAQLVANTNGSGSSGSNAERDIQLAPQEGNLIKDSERSQVTPVHVDVSSLSVAEPSGNLVAESERIHPQPVKVNTDHLSLAAEKKAEQDEADSTTSGKKPNPFL